MKRDFEAVLAGIVQELFDAPIKVELTRPEEQFGDYATNVALQLAKQLGKNPRQVAEQLAGKLRHSLADQIADIYVAGPGFINFKISDQSLLSALDQKPIKSLANQTIVAEFSDPNPFKMLHAGHLYTSIVGEAVANLLEQAGATVRRVNFGGDVGLHVARTMWAIVQELGGENPQKLSLVPGASQAEWLAQRYVMGSKAYDDNEQAKAEIIELNQRIYQLHADNDHASPLAQIYWKCRHWSYDYFDAFYARIGIHFDKYYPESETTPLGLETVRSHLGTIYEKSDGAVIFNGEKYGLHTRVFINSQGLPTYEAKDVGLIMKKWQDYHFDKSIIITGNDIIEYMKVVLKSVEQFMPDLPARTTHLTHGQVKLHGGAKMSSRQGNVVGADEVLNATASAAQSLSGQSSVQTVLGAVKYAFLKNRLGGDIIYDPAESVVLEGNSGPYLQYAHARACSILRKAESPRERPVTEDLEPDERSLALKISQYQEVVDLATAELMPHHICSYLYELAQTFNRFYEKNRVIGDARESSRLYLIKRYSETLHHGLNLLGIVAPDKM